MGGNKKNQQQQQAGGYNPNYGPNPGQSGGDPRGRQQNQGNYQQQRYEQQQGPMVDAMAYNYGRGSEADYANYTDIMNQYRGLAQGGGPQAGKIQYNDPFKSYGGYEEFSQTGGYSPEDIRDMRARGVSPIRANYMNMTNEMQRQKNLAGGYSPNMGAVMTKLGSQRGQMAADAVQKINADLAEARNRGRLAGLAGMSGIEGQRLGADIDVQKWNSQADMMNNQNRLAALQGMSSLYGTTPGMSNAFGNQLLQGVGQGGNFGLGLINAENQSQQLPGRYDTWTDRISDVSNAAYPWLDYFQNRKKQQGSNLQFQSPVQARGPMDYDAEQGGGRT